MNVYIGDPYEVFSDFDVLEKNLSKNTLFLITGSAWIRFRDQMLFIMSCPNHSDMKLKIYEKSKSFKAKSGLLCAADGGIFDQTELSKIPLAQVLTNIHYYNHIFSKSTTLYVNNNVYVEAE